MKQICWLVLLVYHTWQCFVVACLREGVYVGTGSVAFEGGGRGGCNFVGESGMSVPLLTIAATALMAPTPLPALTGFTFSHSHTANSGGCSTSRTH